MAAPDFRICPTCGTRNKKGWEYCVRCGEDLHAVPVGEPAPAALDAEDAIESDGPTWLSLVGPLVAIGLALYAGIRLYKPTSPTRPSSDLFVLASVPPSRAPARPDVVAPGQDDFEQGQRLFAQGDAAGAVTPLARAVAADPDNPAYHDVYAKALIASNGPAVEAIRQFEEAIRLAPRTSMYLADLARAYDKLGRNDEAAAMYARALDLSPNDGQVLREIGGLYTRTGHPEAAVPYLKRLNASSDNLVAQQELGYALDKTGDHDGAKQVYQDILAKFPTAAVTRGLLAEIMIKEGKNDDAVTLLRAGVEADPSAPLMHRTLASALERTGNVAEAVREYREYARLNPGAPDAKTMEDRAARLEARVAQSS